MSQLRASTWWARLSLKQRAALLKSSSPVFAPVPASALAPLLSDARVLWVPPRALLYQEGETTVSPPSLLLHTNNSMTGAVVAECAPLDANVKPPVPGSVYLVLAGSLALTVATAAHARRVLARSSAEATAALAAVPAMDTISKGAAVSKGVAGSAAKGALAGGRRGKGGRGKEAIYDLVAGDLTAEVKPRRVRTHKYHDSGYYAGDDDSNDDESCSCSCSCSEADSDSNSNASGAHSDCSCSCGASDAGCDDDDEEEGGEVDETDYCYCDGLAPPLDAGEVLRVKNTYGLHINITPTSNSANNKTNSSASKHNKTALSLNANADAGASASSLPQLKFRCSHCYRPFRPDFATNDIESSANSAHSSPTSPNRNLGRARRTPHKTTLARHNNYGGNDRGGVNRAPHIATASPGSADGNLNDPAAAAAAAADSESQDEPIWGHRHRDAYALPTVSISRAASPHPLGFTRTLGSGGGGGNAAAGVSPIANIGGFIAHSQPPRHQKPMSPSGVTASGSSDGSSVSSSSRRLFPPVSNNSNSGSSAATTTSAGFHVLRELASGPLDVRASDSSAGPEIKILTPRSFSPSRPAHGSLSTTGTAPAPVNAGLSGNASAVVAGNGAPPLPPRSQLRSPFSLSRAATPGAATATASAAGGASNVTNASAGAHGSPVKIVAHGHRKSDGNAVFSDARVQSASLLVAAAAAPATLSNSSNPEASRSPFVSVRSSLVLGGSAANANGDGARVSFVSRDTAGDASSPHIVPPFCRPLVVLAHQTSDKHKNDADINVAHASEQEQKQHGGVSKFSREGAPTARQASRPSSPLHSQERVGRRPQSPLHAVSGYSDREAAPKGDRSNYTGVSPKRGSSQGADSALLAGSNAHGHKTMFTFSQTPRRSDGSATVRTTAANTLNDTPVVVSDDGNSGDKAKPQAPPVPSSSYELALKAEAAADASFIPCSLPPALVNHTNDDAATTNAGDDNNVAATRVSAQAISLSQSFGKFVNGRFMATAGNVRPQTAGSIRKSNEPAFAAQFKAIMLAAAAAAAAEAETEADAAAAAAEADAAAEAEVKTQAKRDAYNAVKSASALSGDTAQTQSSSRSRPRLQRPATAGNTRCGNNSNAKTGVGASSTSAALRTVLCSSGPDGNSSGGGLVSDQQPSLGDFLSFKVDLLTGKPLTQQQQQQLLQQQQQQQQLMQAQMLAQGSIDSNATGSNTATMMATAIATAAATAATVNTGNASYPHPAAAACGRGGVTSSSGGGLSSIKMMQKARALAAAKMPSFLYNPSVNSHANVSRNEDAEASKMIALLSSLWPDQSSEINAIESSSNNPFAALVNNNNAGNSNNNAVNAEFTATALLHAASMLTLQERTANQLLEQQQQSSTGSYFGNEHGLSPEAAYFLRAADYARAAALSHAVTAAARRCGLTSVPRGGSQGGLTSSGHAFPLLLLFGDITVNPDAWDAVTAALSTNSNSRNLSGVLSRVSISSQGSQAHEALQQQLNGSSKSNSASSNITTSSGAAVTASAGASKADRDRAREWALASPVLSRFVAAAAAAGARARRIAGLAPLPSDVGASSNELVHPPGSVSALLPGDLGTYSSVLKGAWRSSDRLGSMVDDLKTSVDSLTASGRSKSAPRSRRQNSDTTGDTGETGTQGDGNITGRGSSRAATVRASAADDFPLLAAPATAPGPAAAATAAAATAAAARLLRGEGYYALTMRGDARAPFTVYQTAARAQSDSDNNADSELDEYDAGSDSGSDDEYVVAHAHSHAHGRSHKQRRHHRHCRVHGQSATHSHLGATSLDVALPILKMLPKTRGSFTFASPIPLPLVQPTKDNVSTTLGAHTTSVLANSKHNAPDETIASAADAQMRPEISPFLSPIRVAPSKSMSTAPLDRLHSPLHGYTSPLQPHIERNSLSDSSLPDGNKNNNESNDDDTPVNPDGDNDTGSDRDGGRERNLLPPLPPRSPSAALTHIQSRSGSSCESSASSKRRRFLSKYPSAESSSAAAPTSNTAASCRAGVAAVTFSSTDSVAATAAAAAAAKALSKTKADSGSKAIFDAHAEAAASQLDLLSPHIAYRSQSPSHGLSTLAIRAQSPSPHGRLLSLARSQSPSMAHGHVLRSQSPSHLMRVSIATSNATVGNQSVQSPLLTVAAAAAAAAAAATGTGAVAGTATPALPSRAQSRMGRPQSRALPRPAAGRGSPAPHGYAPSSAAANDTNAENVAAVGTVIGVDLTSRATPTATATGGTETATGATPARGRSKVKAAVNVNPNTDANTVDSKNKKSGKDNRLRPQPPPGTSTGTHVSASLDACDDTDLLAAPLSSLHTHGHSSATVSSRNLVSKHGKNKSSVNANKSDAVPPVITSTLTLLLPLLPASGAPTLVTIPPGRQAAYLKIPIPRAALSVITGGLSLRIHARPMMNSNVNSNAIIASSLGNVTETTSGVVASGSDGHRLGNPLDTICDVYVSTEDVHPSSQSHMASSFPLDQSKGALASVSVSASPVAGAVQVVLAHSHIVAAAESFHHNASANSKHKNANVRLALNSKNGSDLLCYVFVGVHASHVRGSKWVLTSNLVPVPTPLVSLALSGTAGARAAAAAADATVAATGAAAATAAAAAGLSATATAAAVAAAISTAQASAAVTASTHTLSLSTAAVAAAANDPSQGYVVDAQKLLALPYGDSDGVAKSRRRKQHKHTCLYHKRESSRRNSSAPNSDNAVAAGPAVTTTGIPYPPAPAASASLSLLTLYPGHLIDLHDLLSSQRPPRRFTAATPVHATPVRVPSAYLGKTRRHSNKNDALENSECCVSVPGAVVLELSAPMLRAIFSVPRSWAVAARRALVGLTAVHSLLCLGQVASALALASLPSALAYVQRPLATAWGDLGESADDADVTPLANCGTSVSKHIEGYLHPPTMYPVNTNPIVLTRHTAPLDSTTSPTDTAEAHLHSSGGYLDRSQQPASAGLWYPPPVSLLQPALPGEKGRLNFESLERAKVQRPFREDINKYHNSARSQGRLARPKTAKARVTFSDADMNGSSANGSNIVSSSSLGAADTTVAQETGFAAALRQRRPQPPSPEFVAAVASTVAAKHPSGLPLMTLSLTQEQYATLQHQHQQQSASSNLCTVDSTASSGPVGVARPSGVSCGPSLCNQAALAALRHMAHGRAPLSQSTLPQSVTTGATAAAATAGCSGAPPQKLRQQAPWGAPEAAVDAAVEARSRSNQSQAAAETAGAGSDRAGQSNNKDVAAAGTAILALAAAASITASTSASNKNGHGSNGSGAGDVKYSHGHGVVIGTKQGSSQDAYLHGNNKHRGIYNALHLDSGGLPAPYSADEAANVSALNQASTINTALLHAAAFASPNDNANGAANAGASGAGTKATSSSSSSSLSADASVVGGKLRKSVLNGVLMAAAAAGAPGTDVSAVLKLGRLTNTGLQQQTQSQSKSAGNSLMIEYNLPDAADYDDDADDALQTAEADTAAPDFSMTSSLAQPVTFSSFTPNVNSAAAPTAAPPATARPPSLRSMPPSASAAATVGPAARTRYSAAFALSTQRRAHRHLRTHTALAAVERGVVTVGRVEPRLQSRYGDESAERATGVLLDRRMYRMGTASYSNSIMSSTGYSTANSTMNTSTCNAIAVNEQIVCGSEAVDTANVAANIPRVGGSDGVVSPALPELPLQVHVQMAEQSEQQRRSHDHAVGVAAAAAAATLPTVAEVSRRVSRRSSLVAQLYSQSQLSPRAAPLSSPLTAPPGGGGEFALTPRNAATLARTNSNALLDSTAVSGSAVSSGITAIAENSRDDNDYDDNSSSDKTASAAAARNQLSGNGSLNAAATNSTQAVTVPVHMSLTRVLSLHLPTVPPPPEPVYLSPRVRPLPLHSDYAHRDSLPLGHLQQGQLSRASTGNAGVGAAASGPGAQVQMPAHVMSQSLALAQSIQQAQVLQQQQQQPLTGFFSANTMLSSATGSSSNTNIPAIGSSNNGVTLVPRHRRQTSTLTDGSVSPRNGVASPRNTLASSPCNSVASPRNSLVSQWSNVASPRHSGHFGSGNNDTVEPGGNAPMPSISGVGGLTLSGVSLHRTNSNTSAGNANAGDETSANPNGTASLAVPTLPLANVATSTAAPATLRRGMSLRLRSSFNSSSSSSSSSTSGGNPFYDSAVPLVFSEPSENDAALSHRRVVSMLATSAAARATATTGFYSQSSVALSESMAHARAAATAAAAAAVVTGGAYIGGADLGSLSASGAFSASSSLNASGSLNSHSNTGDFAASAAATQSQQHQQLQLQMQMQQRAAVPLTPSLTHSQQHPYLGMLAEVKARRLSLRQVAVAAAAAGRLRRGSHNTATSSSLGTHGVNTQGASTFGVNPQSSIALAGGETVSANNTSNPNNSSDVDSGVGSPKLANIGVIVDVDDEHEGNNANINLSAENDLFTPRTHFAILDSLTVDSATSDAHVNVNASASFDSVVTETTRGADVNVAPATSHVVCVSNDAKDVTSSGDQSTTNSDARPHRGVPARPFSPRTVFTFGAAVPNPASNNCENRVAGHVGISSHADLNDGAVTDAGPTRPRRETHAGEMDDVATAAEAAKPPLAETAASTTTVANSSNAVSAIQDVSASRNTVASRGVANITISVPEASGLDLSSFSAPWSPSLSRPPAVLTAETRASLAAAAAAAAASVAQAAGVRAHLDELPRRYLDRDTSRTVALSLRQARARAVSQGLASVTTTNAGAGVSASVGAGVGACRSGAGSIAGEPTERYMTLAEQAAAAAVTSVPPLSQSQTVAESEKSEKHESAMITAMKKKGHYNDIDDASTPDLSVLRVSRPPSRFSGIGPAGAVLRRPSTASNTHPVDKLHSQHQSYSQSLVHAQPGWSGLAASIPRAQSTSVTINANANKINVGDTGATAATAATARRNGSAGTSVGVGVGVSTAATGAEAARLQSRTRGRQRDMLAARSKPLNPEDLFKPM